MPSPTGSGNPSRYEINPEDDRAIRSDEVASRAYFAAAQALDVLTEDLLTREVWPKLNKSSRTAFGTAIGALRRAAFGVVVFAEVDDAKP